MRQSVPSRVAAFVVALLVALAGPGAALAHGLTHAHLASAHAARGHERHDARGHDQEHAHDQAQEHDRHQGRDEEWDPSLHAHASARTAALAPAGSPQATVRQATVRQATVAPAGHDHAHGHAALDVAPLARDVGHPFASPIAVAVVPAPAPTLDVRVVRPPAVTHPATLPRPDPATGPPGDPRAPPAC